MACRLRRCTYVKPMCRFTWPAEERAFRLSGANEQILWPQQATASWFFFSPSPFDGNFAWGGIFYVQVSHLCDLTRSNWKTLPVSFLDMDLLSYVVLRKPPQDDTCSAIEITSLGEVAPRISLPFSQPLSLSLSSLCQPASQPTSQFLPGPTYVRHPCR